MRDTTLLGLRVASRISGLDEDVHVTTADRDTDPPWPVAVPARVSEVTLMRETRCWAA